MKSFTANDKKKINNLMRVVWINAFKNFGKIMLAIIVCFFYATMSVYFISPMSASKMFKFLGLKRAEESCYVFSYERDKNIANLYNLVIFEMEQGYDEKELIYLNMLLADDNYYNFCQKLDESSLVEVKNKALVAYSCNSNSFLINQKVKCMYNLNISDNSICDFVRSKLSNDETAEYSLATYVDLILADTKLSETEKILKLKFLYNDNSLMNYLNAKIEKLKIMSNKTDITLAQKLILQNALVTNAKGKYLVLKYAEQNQEIVSSAQTFYETEYAAYRLLITKN